MNQTPSDLSAWIKENFARLRQTSPKFFNVWNKINTVLLLAAGIPTAMVWMQNIFEVDISAILPAYWVRVILKIVAFAAAYGKLMNKLTVASPHEIIVTNDGVAIQKPCEDLPFTAKKEEPKVVIP